ncbi:DUF7524 family protein [Natronococcus jeotgali]|uniref:Uncharacterized protein n=1 Tax=Natronococcus jeotgali DSM 18795 TaxID=1227498 RepID=L9WSJ3_9EURY|nr:hypothetical protein [Natronococcus jeotgali]ELY52402.1 hypothetical protein C492_19239 [Natronococcus jeotgali DSM 18795]
MFTPAVTVHVNRDSPERLEAATATFETAEPFTLLLEGHDTPTHVHCRLDEELARVASLPQSNYYVEADARTPVPIDVDPSGLEDPVQGYLEVSTGYGAESAAIAVTIEPGPDRVEVDESLARPNRSASDGDGSSEPSRPLFGDRESSDGLSPTALAALALGGVALALVLALAVAATAGGTTAVAVFAVVAVAVVAAVGLRVRD